MAHLIHEYSTGQAARRPEALALSLGDSGLTYGELESLSNRIARVLRDSGCRRGDRVNLLIPKSPMAAAAILGILKADCIYVPVDAESPVARGCRIIESCEPRIVLADASCWRLVSGLQAACAAGAFRIGWLDPTAARPSLPTAFDIAAVESASGDPVEAVNGEDDPAYILFTSGSTGVPKGVVISHRNIRQYIEWAVRYFSMGSDDRISGHTPLHFDLSTMDLYTAFAAGAELHLVPTELNLRPDGLVDFIRARRLTQWFSVPAVLNYVAKFNALDQGDFPELRRVMWCGEVLPLPALRYWMERLPHASFTNLYGPTETTVASSFYTVPSIPGPDAAAIPIGSACGGEELLVLDDRMQRTAPGEIGHLYIAGVGLSPGYWRDPEKTAAAFVPNPFSANPADRLYRTGDLARLEDGLVYFLGRQDSQIKARGYRIELGEIEAALDEIVELQESAIVATHTEGFENTAICCAYSPVPGLRITPVHLRGLLKDKIPAYMIPTRWMELERLPRNANGKTDKVMLRELFANHEAGSPAPRRAKDEVGSGIES